MYHANVNFYSAQMQYDPNTQNFLTSCKTAMSSVNAETVNAAISLEDFQSPEFPTDRPAIVRPHQPNMLSPQYSALHYV